MSKIQNGGLGQYGAEPFEQQQCGTAGVEGVKQLKQFHWAVFRSESVTGMYKCERNADVICWLALTTTTTKVSMVVC